MAITAINVETQYLASLLYTRDHRKQMGIAFGVLHACVEAVFAHGFDIMRVERGTFWDSGSTWFWMERKP